MVPVRRFLNHVDVRYGGVVGIPQYVPFGMTGGIAAIGVELPGIGLPLNNRWSDGNDVSLEQAFECIGSSELARLFTEGRIPAAKLDPWFESSVHAGGGYVRQWDPSQDHPIVEIGDCVVSRVTLPSTAAAPIPGYRESFGSPTVWVMEQGAMRVVSPQGTVVDLDEGDACFVPAAARGVYTLIPRATEPDAAAPLISYLAVTGMPNPLSRAIAASGCASMLSGAPVLSAPFGVRPR